MPYLVIPPFLTSDLFSSLSVQYSTLSAHSLMATLSASGSSSTSPRWGRIGEPGSAFSGLSRGRGRGRGGAGGSNRGGRGRSRRGISTTEAEDEVSSAKPDNSLSGTSSPISPSPSTSAPGKPNVPPDFSSKPKLASRGGSRAISVPAFSQINESLVTVSASTPKPAKSSNKRRRSQAGKPAPHILSKTNPPTSNDGPIRPNRPHLESHTDTFKDIPPHLNGKFDVRNDIDALVERVRAVAMDNRPSTPKSHIDWAVDDDDTLPDLDDWGVPTSTLTATQLEVISPIIVDGLRSLPEITANSTVSSPLKQIEAVVVQPIIGAHSSSNNGITSDKVVPPSTKEEVTKQNFSEPMTKHESRMLNLKVKSPQSNTTISLHPSPLAEPLFVDSVVQHISKPSPVWIGSHPESPITPIVDLPRMPGRPPAANSEQTQEPTEVTTEMTHHRLPGEHLIIVEPTITESAISKVSLDRGADYSQTAQEPFSSDLSGLGASMHAPKGIADSVSAPANLSTYADYRAHDPIHTHIRAHTVGRSPLPDSTIRGKGDYMSRFTRSGHTTPGGMYQGNSHARTHSTPPAGANHHRSPQTSRPVITGDAISRLARTIGQTHNNLSPPKGPGS